jgi:hypothetical protein
MFKNANEEFDIVIKKRAKEDFWGENYESWYLLL